MWTFLLKWVLHATITALLLMWFAGITLTAGALAGTVIALASWLIGDQMLLRATNNIVATLMDALLAGVVLWGAAAWLGWDLGFGELFVIAAVLGVFEWMLHRYLLRDEALSDIHS